MMHIMGNDNAVGTIVDISKGAPSKALQCEHHLFGIRPMSYILPED